MIFITLYNLKKIFNLERWIELREIERNGMGVFDVIHPMYSE